MQSTTLTLEDIAVMFARFRLLVNEKGRTNPAHVAERSASSCILFKNPYLV